MESSYENWNGDAAYPRIIGTEGPKIGGADFFCDTRLVATYNIRLEVKNCVGYNN